MKTLLSLFILICTPIFTFAQLNFSYSIIDICDVQDLENCETYQVKTLLNINEEETILKIINSSNRFTYYIVESEFDEEENLFFFTLVREDEVEYLGIFNPQNNQFKMIFKDGNQTIMNIFYN
ncbi:MULTISPECIES: hypothetical protein [unclassified Empedobacter]|uniref:hypothetical protein n=1 Tax=unclassified Empedobacter TaxID=2643773 RepID=UPI0025BC98C6|nr:MULTISPECIES: hypothetical protein [unclassified Empedobacter]